MAGGPVPRAIVLALGAGALGGPDALRLLLQFAGRSPAVDVAMCVVAISLVTAPLLGSMLLARFVRKARAGGGGAPATDLFAQMTAAVSVGAAFLVTACLLVVPGGGLGAARLPIDFAVNNPFVVTILAICAAFAAAAGGGSLPCAVPLPRFFRGAGSTSIKVVVSLVAVSSLVALSDVFDAHAQLLFPGFHWRRRRMVTMPVGVAIASAIVTVAGTALLLRCARRARNAAGVGGGAAAQTRGRRHPHPLLPPSLSLWRMSGPNSN